MSFSAFLIGTVVASSLVLAGLLAAPRSRRTRPAATGGLMAMVAARVDPLPDGVRFGQDDLLD